MGRRHAFPPLLLFLFSLFLFHASHAFFIWEHRKLVALDSKDLNNNNKTDTPPNDSLPPSQKKPDPNPAAETKNNKEDPKGSNNNTISPKGSNNNTIVPPNLTPLPKVENEKGDKQKELKNSAPPANAPPPVAAKSSGEEEKNKKEGKPGSESITDETCGLNKCKDDGNMVACISIIEPKYLIVLIQNNGDGPIKVKPLVENNREDIEVGKHQTKKINISLISSEITQLTLNAGKGDCVLHKDPRVPEANFFLRLPSFDNILTPVNGAYFLIFTVLVFGGTWGCCKLRKKRHDEVPYQELEMALPESASATNVESAEGWDQDWDDDWDDNVAVKSPAAHHAGSISANGLTSRSSNKDGWENNWDD